MSWLDEVFFPERARAERERRARAAAAKAYAEYRRTGMHYWYAITGDGLDMAIGRKRTREQARREAVNRARKLGRETRIVRVYHLDQPPEKAVRDPNEEELRGIKRALREAHTSGIHAAFEHYPREIRRAIREEYMDRKGNLLRKGRQLLGHR